MALQLLRILLNHNLFVKYAQDLEYLYKDSKELGILYRYLTSLHEKYERDVSPTEYSLYVLCNCMDKDKETLSQLLKSIAEVDESAIILDDLLQTVTQRKQAYDLALAALEVSEGRREFNDLVTLSGGLTEITQASTVNEDTFVTDDLEALYKGTVQTQGLRWRLGTLNTMMGSLRKGDFGFIFARPECFAKGTKVLLQDGRSLEIERLISGMKVMGPDSTPRHVIATSHGYEKMYRVSYGWGDYYVCNESHVLHLTDGETTTQVKVKDYLNWSAKCKLRFKQMKVGISLPEKSVALDPYVLGIWLGDGTSSKAEVTSMDTEVISYFQNWAESSNLVCNIYDRASQGKAKTIAISSKTRKHGANTFMQFLKGNRLFKNKHIPDAYLRNSKENRLQLLAGLLDSDGWKAQGSYGFCNKNELLVDQVVWLVRSLGFHATKHPKTVNGTIYYNVGIYGDCSTIPVKIERKKIEKSSRRTKRGGLWFGFSIEEDISVSEYYGIQVSHDSLYLLDDFTIVHNTGKTTFLASEITHFATQATKPILWFNNEEQGSKVQLRLYQAMLGLTLAELYSDIPGNRKRYMELGGSNIKIFDSASIHRRQVEQLCRELEPSLIIFDQIDKIKGFTDDREDLRLGSIYIWARELAKEYCPAIGVSQADASGEGKRWLTMENVANAKTAKQAEADWILGIGKTHSEAEEYMRHLSLCKNKLTGDADSDPTKRHGRESVIIEPEIARYRDM